MVDAKTEVLMVHKMTKATAPAHRIGQTDDGRPIYQHIAGWQLECPSAYTRDESGNYVLLSAEDAERKGQKMQTIEITPHQAEAMNPWQLAQALSTPDCEIQFTGDMNPFDHGGTFYETSNWNKYGYAECVRFIDVEGTTLVECATINKPGDQRDLTTVGQIEACLAYMGAETHEDFSGRYAESFDEDQESAAWETALPWIQGLTR